MKEEEKDISGTATLVRHGAYQYVLLPKEFEFDGNYVLIGRYRSGVVLKPLPANQTSPGKQARRKLT